MFFETCWFCIKKYDSNKKLTELQNIKTVTLFLLKEYVFGDFCVLGHIFCISNQVVVFSIGCRIAGDIGFW